MILCRASFTITEEKFRCHSIVLSMATHGPIISYTHHYVDDDWKQFYRSTIHSSKIALGQKIRLFMFHFRHLLRVSLAFGKDLTCNSILLDWIWFRYIGLILTVGGICTAIFSYVFGGLVKYIGRSGCIFIAAALNYASIAAMYFWEPRDDQIYVLYIVSCLWGTADAVWTSQVVGKNLFFSLLKLSYRIHTVQLFTLFSMLELIQVL